MSEVEFNSENFQSVYSSNSGGFDMRKWLVHKRIVKTEEAASRILIGVAVLFFAITAYSFYSSYTASRAGNLTEEQKQAFIKKIDALRSSNIR